MIVKSESYWAHQRGGLTLIEVVAGLSLLSIVLVTGLVGMRHLDRQLRMAADKIKAVQAADQLLSHWFAWPADFPWQSSGRVSVEGTALIWETERCRDRDAAMLGIPKVRMTMHRPGELVNLVAVEVLVPLTPPNPSSP